MTFKLNTSYSSIAEQGEYIQLSRLDILCGLPSKLTIFPCRVCNKDTCQGEIKECKEDGSYALGNRYIE